jgi:hypothetical protein
MKTRRMVYWWFRLVVSGRFLGKFSELATHDALSGQTEAG